MRAHLYFKVAVSFLLLLLFLPILVNENKTAAAADQNVYDFANLLTEDEILKLENVANKYGSERETDFIIITTNDPQTQDIVEYTEDFYDEEAPGYDKPHGSTAILTIDMFNRDVYLAGFYKAEEYLDSGRLDQIRGKITPFLANGDYDTAFHTYLKTSFEYMAYRPGVNPENILLKLWFQLVASLAIAGIIVGSMVFNTGGKVTVNASTYIDPSNSNVVQERDAYIRTSISKVKKPSNNNGSGGGGGGISGGGHSHSGSRGSF